jgi:phage terminase small subunit
MWVHLAAAFESSVAPSDEGKPPVRPMPAAFLAQLRALGSELGFDPASRARFGTQPSTKRQPGEDLLDN